MRPNTHRWKRRFLTIEAFQHEPQLLCAMNSLYAGQGSCSVSARAGPVPQLPARVSAGHKQDGLVRPPLPMKNQGTVGLQDATEVKEVLQHKNSSSTVNVFLSSLMVHTGSLAELVSNTDFGKCNVK